MKSAIQSFFQKSIRVLMLVLVILLSSSNICFSQTGKQLVVVAFGNSTTAPRKGIQKVYAIRLHEMLSNKGIDNKVINAGIPGSHTGSVKDNNRFKTPHGMDRFDTAVLAYHPDWVTINFGINDSWQDSGKKSKSRINVKEYRHNLIFFINGIRKEGGRVILLTPQSMGKIYRGYHLRRLKKYRNVVIH